MTRARKSRIPPNVVVETGDCALVYFTGKRKGVAKISRQHLWIIEKFGPFHLRLQNGVEIPTASIGSQKHNLGRLITCADKNEAVFHKNGDELDLRAENLVKVPHSHRHQDKRQEGVHYCQNKKRWRATIQENNKRTHLGWFKTEEEAIRARHDQASPISKTSSRRDP